MPDVLVAAMLTLAVAVGWIGVVRLTRSVRHTSLTAAAAWAIWFQTILTVTTIATIAKSRVPLGILDQLWYLTAVSALCPFVAVLGARRGRLLEWSLFIVLPLIVVLEWSALAQLTRCWHGQRLVLEPPAMVGYGVVFLMGVGNYVGAPRFFWSVVTGWLGSWLAFMICLLTYGRGISIIEHARIFFLIAFFHTWFWFSVDSAPLPDNRYSGWDRVWRDFRDYFGFAWPARVMARINEVAQRDRWAWNLTDEGLRPISTQEIAAGAGTPTDDPRIDQTFRWLLKPFVDPEWIDERLKASTDRASDG